ncbi:MAG TPA: FAD-binding oxidoreductase, partial [Vicinamibacterales bacterium]|nr:FAD-binding oxidoreductase [Vicinamibacterales bacterium]
TPPPADVVVATTKLTAGIDHVPGDLVATVPAGVSLDALNDVLGRERQWLPLDPPLGRQATIGGIVATNDSGPRRHRFGAPRDLIIGIEIALVDGRVAKAGGRVVKNVAGYDLSKLMCGSLGTLAVVTKATFKLSPVAPFSQTLVASLGDIRQLSLLALTLANAPPLSPTAIELESPPHRLLVRFETTEGAALAQTKIAARLCEQFGATTGVLSGQAEREAWNQHEARIFQAPGTVVKIAVLPTDCADMLSTIERLTSAATVECEMSGRLALGIILLRLDGALPAHASVVSAIRRHASARRGSAVIVSAPDDVVRDAGRWGSVGDAAPVMRAVKARFDPHNILNATQSPWD